MSGWVEGIGKSIQRAFVNPSQQLISIYTTAMSLLGLRTFFTIGASHCMAVAWKGEFVPLECGSFRSLSALPTRGCQAQKSLTPMLPHIHLLLVTVGLGYDRQA